MQSLPEPLRPLAAYAQFIVWAPVWNPALQKYDKKPRDPVTGRDTDHTNPAAWMTFDVASAIATRNGWGVGFELTRNDPFFCVDIDGALTHTGGWSPIAHELCQLFGGAAVEVSYSGTGLHIFGVGQYPAEHPCKNIPLGIEFYTQGRFMAITGTNAVGNAFYDCTPAIAHFIAHYLPTREVHGSADWTVEAVPDWNGPEDDDILIAKMLSSKPSAAAAFKSRATVRELWEGDVEALSRYFPPKEVGSLFDHSSADAALCQHLAFWTGKNCERIERIFARSALVRDKWNDREKYRHDTITLACAWCSAVYQAKKKKELPPPAPYAVGADIDDGAIRDGYQYLGLPQQLEHFKGCVYVHKAHAVWSPTWGFQKPEQFKATYGGYWFALDSIGDKSTKNAWEAFTESQGIRHPKALLPCFRPELESGIVITEEGQRKVNTYVPIQVPRRAGDPTPFLQHMEKLLPDPRDRDILLAWMAAAVQFTGVKLRWAPLIQGVEGNGKTILSKAVARAVGMRYSHSPKASEIANNFNAWVEEKLFAYVEDVYTADKQEVMETLKPMITGTELEIEPKGRDKYMADNRVNFMLNSNYQDGVRKTRNDRRIAPFFTAQQQVEDLDLYGMTASYFKWLDNWLHTEGFEIIAEYLHTYQIPEALNPLNMSRAPATSSTEDAIQAGLGGVEQEIFEAVAQGRPGFAGGWISSIALDRLIEQRRDARRIPPNKRRDVLYAMGYVYHPGLNDGRTTAPVAIDGGSKPRLYIKKGHLSSQLTQPMAIVEAYTKAQEIGGVDSLAAGVFGGAVK